MDGNSGFVSRSLHGPQSGGFYACTLQNSAAQQSTVQVVLQRMSLTIRSTLRSLCRRERDYLQRYFAQAEDATDLATVVHHMKRLVSAALAGDGEVGASETMSGKDHISQQPGGKCEIPLPLSSHHSMSKGQIDSGDHLSAQQRDGWGIQVDVGCKSRSKAEMSDTVSTSTGEGAQSSAPECHCTGTGTCGLHPRAHMRNILKVCSKTIAFCELLQAFEFHMSMHPVAWIGAFLGQTSQRFSVRSANTRDFLRRIRLFLCGI